MADTLTLNHVTKRYGDDDPVLENLSHAFPPGTLTLLTGPNGSGKTTLLRLLSVLSYPTEGSIQYGDLVVHDHPYRYLQHVGIVHASGQLPEHLTAVELLEWMARSRGTWADDGPDRLHALLDRLHLDERRAALLRTYSSGMVKKTQIAAAFLARPDVVLMDEPLRSLDTATTNATLGLVSDFVASGGVAIVASHITTALREHADVVLSLAPDTAPADA
jgi:ABC-2 type transport system ATP-binding protein